MAKWQVGQKVVFPKGVWGARLANGALPDGRLLGEAIDDINGCHVWAWERKAGRTVLVPDFKLSWLHPAAGKYPFLQGKLSTEPRLPRRVSLQPPGSQPEVDLLLQAVAEQLRLNRPVMTDSNDAFAIGCGQAQVAGQTEVIGWVYDLKQMRGERVSASGGSMLCYIAGDHAIGKIQPDFLSGQRRKETIYWRGCLVPLGKSEPYLMSRNESTLVIPLCPYSDEPNKQLCIITESGGAGSSLASWDAANGLTQVLQLPAAYRPTFYGKGRDGTVCLGLEWESDFRWNRQFCLWHPDREHKFVPLNDIGAVPTGMFPHLVTLCGESLVLAAYDQDTRIGTEPHYFVLDKT